MSELSNLTSLIATGTGWSERTTKPCVSCNEPITCHPICFPICGRCDARLRPPLQIPEMIKIRLGQSFHQVVAERGIAKVHDTTGRIHIPSLYQNATAMDDLIHWAANPYKPLVLMGPAGTGKTWQACGLIRHLVGQYSDGDGFLVNCATVAKASTVDLTTYAKARVICLDDFGARLTPGALATAYELIDTRIANQRPLIITTNATGGEISTIDERIASRILSGRLVMIDGRDRRIAQSKGG